MYCYHCFGLFLWTFYLVFVVVSSGLSMFQIKVMEDELSPRLDDTI